jgi:hypothetical protein
MMKQPAENTNATAEETKRAEQRSRPLERNCLKDRERTDELVHRLGGDKHDSDPSIRSRAEEVLRNQKNAEAKP